jgi:hypothetical protein
MQVEQFSARYPFDGAEARCELIGEQRGGVRASERADHPPVYDTRRIPSTVTEALEPASREDRDAD